MSPEAVNELIARTQPGRAEAWHNSRQDMLFHTAGIGSQFLHSGYMDLPLTLPDDMEGLDLALRASNTVNFDFAHENSVEQCRIAYALQEGMEHWQYNALTSARRMFSEAAEQINDVLQKGGVPDIVFLYYINPENWPSRCQSVSKQFVNFLTNAVAQAPDVPDSWSLVARYLASSTNVGRSLALLTRLLHRSSASDGAVNGHWWQLARQRWLVALAHEDYELAESNCDQAVQMLTRTSELTEERQLQLLQARSYIDWKRGEFDQAEQHLQHAMDLLSTIQGAHESVGRLLLKQLAQLHESRGNTLQAFDCYNIAFNKRVANYGTTQVLTVNAFKDLLRFCARYGLQDHREKLLRQHPDLHEMLSGVSEGLWDVSLNDNIVDSSPLNQLSQLTSMPAKFQNIEACFPGETESSDQPDR